MFVLWWSPKWAPWLLAIGRRSEEREALCLEVMLRDRLAASRPGASAGGPDVCLSRNVARVAPDLPGPHQEPKQRAAIGSRVSCVASQHLPSGPSGLGSRKGPTHRPATNRRVKSPHQFAPRSEIANGAPHGSGPAGNTDVVYLTPGTRTQKAREAMHAAEMGPARVSHIQLSSLFHQARRQPADGCRTKWSPSARNLDLGAPDSRRIFFFSQATACGVPTYAAEPMRRPRRSAISQPLRRRRTSTVPPKVGLSSC